MPPETPASPRHAGRSPTPVGGGGRGVGRLTWGHGLRVIWALVLAGLLLRLLRTPSLPGTYPPELDVLLYAGQRLLHGQWLYQGLVTGAQPPAQLLFATSAWLGSIQAHRLLIFALDLLGGALLGRTLQRCSRLGLIRLAPGSPLPFLGGALYITFSQIFPEANAGLPHQFVNLFLVAALERATAIAAACQAGQALPRALQLGAPLWRQLALIGLLLMLASCSLLPVSPPLLVVIALLLVQARQRARLVVPLLSGMGLALALLFLPYLLLPEGPAHAWAGAVVLPIEWTSRVQPLNTPLNAALTRLLTTRLDGLPLWLLLPIPLVGLGRLVRRRFVLPSPSDQAPPGGDPGGGSARSLLLPGLAAVFCLELLFSLERGDADAHDLLLTVPPLVLLITSGLAALAYPARRWSRVLAGLMLVGLSLIYLNNIFVVTISHPPRINRLARQIEADRSRVRSYLQGLSAPERSFTAPQDVALQRQLDEPSATVGIGPSWSLNQKQLPSSAATRALGLPTDRDAVCRQLTGRPTRQLVWMRTDPEGPNTLDFLQDCLQRSGGSWRDVSEELGLASGEYRLFIRQAPGDRIGRP